MEEKNAAIEDTNSSNDIKSEVQLEAFYIFVRNGIYGCKTEAYVTKENWLCQVYELVAEDLGFREKAKCVFENEQGQRTSDSLLSLE